LAKKIEKEDFKKEYAYTVDSSFTKGSNGQGEIYIIPSGNTRKQDTYLESLARIDLGYDLKGFIEDIQIIFELTSENGLILFDSRTGFNDTFAALAEVSNTIVGLFGVNQQNEAGIEFFVKHFQNNIDKNVFFIKGLTDKAKKEEKRLKELIDKYELTIENGENEINLKPYISHVLRIPLLQDLGVLEVKEDKNGREILSPLIDEDDFKDFLISIEKEKDVANMSSFFPEIAKSIEKKKSKTPQIVSENIQIQELAPIIPIPNTLSIEQKIEQWQQDTNIERMLQLKFEFLKTIQSPILWAERESNLQKLADTFYFRAVMRDIFRKDKFIILGGKGAGKTYWYRQLDERYSENALRIQDLCRLENKKRDKYIFANAVIDENLKIDNLTGIQDNLLQEQDFKAFWLLLVHYTLFNHPSIIAIFTSTLANSALTFNEWVQPYIENNVFNSVMVEKELQALNKKLKELNKELMLSFDYLDKIVGIKHWKKSTSTLIRFWEKNPDYSNILPKIFVRADLFNSTKIEINNFIGTKNYSTINLAWSKDELFAYFFTNVLKQQQARDLFFHYLVCIETNIQFYKAKKAIWDIQAQFEESEIKQILPISDDMKQLATIFFGERADFYGENSFKYPLSYDWFIDNLQDALGQVSLRAFWELINLAIQGEGTESKTEYERTKSKRYSEIYFNDNYNHIKATLPANFTRRSQPFPLVEPRFYTWIQHRVEAAEQFFGEIKGEFGNDALENLKVFFKKNVLPMEKKYNYLRIEFEALIQRFLEQEFANNSENIKKIVNSPKETEEIIRWLINNGIVNEVPTDYGDNTKYIFPYFYRSLFSLNEK
jgi:hypothetical protein